MNNLKSRTLILWTCLVWETMLLVGLAIALLAAVLAAFYYGQWWLLLAIAVAPPLGVLLFAGIARTSDAIRTT